ncbi:MAG TPA: hypothetical protein VJ867_11170 [Gemmatimonadaceae bacterium]|nr:hypothetical protein [Gemmatimonadaceae bacterium]
MTTRRDFVRQTATLFGAVIVGTYGCHDADDREMQHPEILRFLGNAEVARIGTQYRATVRAEDDEPRLRELIHRAVAPVRVPGVARRSLDDAVRLDFQRGDVVVADGWVLSRTEARQCALFSFDA